jgi:hypothetical protein
MKVVDLHMLKNDAEDCAQKYDSFLQSQHRSGGELVELNTYFLVGNNTTSNLSLQIHD